MDSSRRRLYWGRPLDSGTRKRRHVIAHSDDAEIRDRKAALRRAARADRDALQSGLGAAAATGLAARFYRTAALRALISPATSIAGYMPIGSEIDCRPLLHRLAADGAPLCLPAVAGPGTPLVFRRWSPGDKLVISSFGIAEPPASAVAVAPPVVLVPLLAFDRAGHRLGYGGGYYDSTLKALRAAGDVVAIGLAFAGQLRDNVPVSGADQPLDWIVTEAGAAAFADGGSVSAFNLGMTT